MRGRRAQVERNLERAYGRPLRLLERRLAVQRTFESYARYWVESFRLPDLTPEEIDARFSVEGFERIEAARSEGVGPIIALPHLGGWEWAAFWMATTPNYPVTAVVEPIEPPELFDWFVSFRESLGMQVVPLGPSAGPAVIRAIRDVHVTCLLCDRDIGGAGVEVEFFGERTTLPGGPATLALRTGAALLPAAVYFEGRNHHGVVRPPIPAERTGRLRDDVTRITQTLAGELEVLISRAPEQWHLMQPNWPSDRRERTDSRQRAS